MTTALQQAEKKLNDLLAEQMSVHYDYNLNQTAEGYAQILKLKKQVARAKQEVAKNK